MKIVLMINLLLSSINNHLVSANQECATFETICSKQTHCQDCIRVHHCCTWCYCKNYLKETRCVVKGSDAYLTCDPSKLVSNLEGNITIREDEDFRDVQNATSDEIQFRPQEFDINLRLNEPVNLTIHYKPAKNFFLDLYYLMDLTKSMQPDLNTITQLGLNLTQLLRNLTTNYKIAFGSYVDKPTSPFYPTDEGQYENPCSVEGVVCEMGYLFKHKLNFTDDVQQFTKKVTESDVSANLDNLEGGLDAVMQILLCGKKIGWSENSRKLVVVATDGRMHLAGDGLLSGSVKRNRHRCLMDNNGQYTLPLLYDYPSLEEIDRELKTKKTNVIIAAKDTTLDYYKQMNHLMHQVTYLGELKNESTNILKLVEEGYYAFMKQVTLSMNTSKLEELGVEFYADCYGDGTWNKTKSCYNAEEERVINFKIELHLKSCPNIDSETFYVEESNINENVKININTVGCRCNCPNEFKKKCVHGTPDCDGCKCDDGWHGTLCDKLCENNWNKCRYQEDGVLSSSCSSRGECICSKCQCNPPYHGEFCEFTCPYDRDQRIFCGGHGVCTNGTCLCDEMYDGIDCKCSKSQEDCKVPGYDELCNGVGTCECNRCKCNPGYSGQFCENCEECEGLCGHYENCVIAYFNKTLGEDNQNCSNQIVRVHEVNETEEKCLYRYDKEDQKCDAYYKYVILHDRSVDVTVQTPKCYKPTVLGAGFISIIIVAAILTAGILAILIWKGRNMYRDRIEYQRFMRNQQMNQNSENPLYKSPITNYDLELMNLHLKSQ